MSVKRIYHMTTTNIITLSQFQKAKIRRVLLKNAQNRWTKKMEEKRNLKRINNNINSVKNHQIQHPII